jgi:hypothetical protein
MKKRYNGSQFSFGEVMKSNGISFPKILDLIAMQEILPITAPQTPLPLKALSTMSAKHHIHQRAKDKKTSSFHSHSHRSALSSPAPT